MNQTWENDKKPSFRPGFGPFGPNSGCHFFLSKIWLHQSLDAMVSYHHVQYQKKLVIQSWESLVTDRETNRQMDNSDFIGRYLTNVERPKKHRANNLKNPWTDLPDFIKYHKKP